MYFPRFIFGTDTSITLIREGRLRYSNCANTIQTVCLWEKFSMHFKVWRLKMTRTHLDSHPVGKYLLACCYLCWGALEMKTNHPQITLMGRLSLLDSTVEMKYNRRKEILALFPDTKSKSSAKRMTFLSSPSSQTRYQIYGSEHTETFPPFDNIT